MLSVPHDLEPLIARYNGAIELSRSMSSFHARGVQEQVKDAVSALESYCNATDDRTVRTILQQVLGGS